MVITQRLIQSFFHLLYNPLAPLYDGIAWLVSLGQWAAWRRTILPLLKDGPVLELAFGTGGLMADMIQNGAAPVGIDLSAHMSRITRRRLTRLDLPLRITQAQAQHLPFPDAAFSNVIATFPTKFLLDPSALLSVRRVLQPEGQLLVVVMGVLRGPQLARQPLEFAYYVTGQRQIPPPDPVTRLEEIGFSAVWREGTLDGATARILIATRL